MLKLFLLEQNDNNNYDTYDSMVVVAKSGEEARWIVPGGAYQRFLRNGEAEDAQYTSWAHHRDSVKATEVGIAAPGLEAGHVVISSFNAG
jgi:hypothetical protein